MFAEHTQHNFIGMTNKLDKDVDALKVSTANQ